MMMSTMLSVALLCATLALVEAGPFPLGASSQCATATRISLDNTKQRFVARGTTKGAPIEDNICSRGFHSSRGQWYYVDGHPQVR
jgi:hypothetical protein